MHIGLLTGAGWCCKCRACGGAGGAAETLGDKKKKKRFITLWCKVNGYDETKQTKEVKDMKITAQDVEMVIKEVLGINVKIDL